MSANHPGCYGSPLCCRPTQSPCLPCPFMQDCKIAAQQRATRLRASYGIDAFFGVGGIKRSARAEPEVANAAPAPNKKASELIAVLARKGIDVPGEIRANRNPFSIRPPAYMRIAVDQLLAGGIERATLKSTFVEELGWTETSAASHVGIATGALLGLGVAQSQGAMMVRA